MIKPIALIAAMALIAARWYWDGVSPLQPGEFKGLIYVRDIALLFPAALCLGWVLLTRRAANDSARREGPLATGLRRYARRAPVILALVFLGASVLIAHGVLKNRAHIPDEANYLFQAKVFASGEWWTPPAPVSGEFFKQLYFHQGEEGWYSSFFPGQGALLAIGETLGAPNLVNPLLGMLLLLLTMWAGRRLYSVETGVLAGILFLISPFVLFQSASYFSHIAPAVLVTVTIALLLRGEDRGGSLFMAGLLSGVLLLFRPLSALVLALFAIGYAGGGEGLTMSERLRGLVARGLMVGCAAMPGLAAFLAYNRRLTGNAFVTAHQLALPDERLVFGLHSLMNSLINLTGLSVDLLGVPILSLVPVAAFFLLRRKHAGGIGLFVVAYALAYSTYPYHGLSYGPRFYFEVMPLLVVAGAEGLHALARTFAARPAGRFVGGDLFIRKALVVVAMIALLGVLPGRVSVFARRGAYYDIEELVRANVTEPAVVMIEPTAEKRLFPYMAGFQLNAPDLQGPVIYVRHLPHRIAELTAAYPDRRLYHLDVATRRLDPVSTRP